MPSLSRTQQLLLACVFLLTLPAVTPRIYASDEIQYFSYLRSLWFDHDLSFENEYQYFYTHGVGRSEGFHETFLERTTEIGRRINFGTIGCAILWAPFYAVGDAVAHVSGAPTDGFSHPYIASVAYGSAFYGFMALLLSAAAARRILGSDPVTAALPPVRGSDPVTRPGRPARGSDPVTVACAAVWIGTPLLFYMYVAPPMSHACSAFAVALFVYTWVRVRVRWSAAGAFALGAAGALMAMVREQDLFFIAGPAIDYAVTALQAWRRQRGAEGPEGARTVAGAVTAIVASGVAFTLAFLPQAISYYRLNGHVGPSRLVTRKMSWTAPHALQVLFSPEHGFFVWTPLALVAIAGVILFSATRERLLGICLLVVTGLQVYVSGSVESWTIAGGFGQRRFVALTVVLVIGYATLLAAVSARSRLARAATIIVTVLCVYWNVALIAEFATGLMDRQHLSPRANAYDAFVTIPSMAPSLAYRYFFDRASFYGRTVSR